MDQISGCRIKSKVFGQTDLQPNGYFSGHLLGVLLTLAGRGKKSFQGYNLCKILWYRGRGGGVKGAEEKKEKIEI